MTEDSEELDNISVGEMGIVYDVMGEIEFLYDDLQEVMDDIEDREPATGNKILLKPEERSALLEFYTVGHARLEQVSANILAEELTDGEDRSTENCWDFFKNNITQSQREDMMFYAGAIDPGLKSEIEKVRKVRNQLVHNQDKRIYLENKTQTDIDRAFRCIENLNEVLKSYLSEENSSTSTS